MSDPYIRVKFLDIDEDVAGQTEHVPNAVHPVWQDNIKLPVGNRPEKPLISVQLWVRARGPALSKPRCARAQRWSLAPAAPFFMFLCSL